MACFVCLFLQLHCLHSRGAVKTYGGHTVPWMTSQLAEAARLGCSGVRDGQQRAPTRLLMNFAKTREKAACLQEIHEGRVLHVCLFQIERGGQGELGCAGVCVCVCASPSQCMWRLYVLLVCIKLGCFLLFKKCRRPPQNKFFERSRSWCTEAICVILTWEREKKMFLIKGESAYPFLTSPSTRVNPHPPPPPQKKSKAQIVL